MTKTLSLNLTVLSLWAIVNIVLSLNSSLITLNTFSSLSTSILEVASSNRIILFFEIIALAKQINYFSPALKLDPEAET